MKKLILLLAIFSLTIFNANASYQKPNPDIKKYQNCNHHKLKVMLISVYDVWLCSNETINYKDLYKKDFVLSINYDLDFKAKKLAEKSIEEINKHYKINEETQKNYYNQLLKIFPEVKENDIISAYYFSSGYVDLYHNGKFRGKINDKIFARQFMDIWLHPNCSYLKMRNQLVGN